MRLELSFYKQLTDYKLYRAVEEICAALIQNGGRPYLVGGCVRDGLLGHEVSDFDIEVFGMSSEDILRILSPKFCLLLQKSFEVFKVKGYNIDLSIPREERKIGDKHRSFSVEPLPLQCTVREAANRRDFTINAIYFDVKGNLLCDPYGGIEDLRNKILRNVGVRFSEDPLRVLRGMQFISRFELAPRDGLIEISSNLSPNEISAERVFLEWKKMILFGKSPSLGLRFLEKCGWTKFFPEIHALIACNQDPYWHPEGSVFNHTCLALDLFASDRVGDHTEDLIVGFAILCHDFGKPVVTTRDDSGVHHYGHDVAGLPQMESFLKRMRAPNWIIEGVRPLVRYHMHLRDNRSEFSQKAGLLKLANKVGRMDRLLRICTYDQHGRGGVWGDPRSKEYELPVIEHAKKVCQELGIFHNPPVPIIHGRDLIKLGLKSSPRFKEILDRAFDAQLSLKFSDYEGGMRYVRTIL